GCGCESRGAGCCCGGGCWCRGGCAVCCRSGCGCRTCPRTVSPAGVGKADATLGGYTTAPNNHFTATPYRRVTCSARGHVRETGRCPTVCAWIVSSAGAQQAD